MFSPINDFLLICNEDGKIKDVFSDSSDIPKSLFVSKLFPSIIHPSNIGKSLDFFAEIKNNSVAFNCDLLLINELSEDPFHFSGGMVDNNISIFASKNKNGLLKYLNGMISISNEQLNIIRNSEKAIAESKNQLRTINSQFEKLSQLNNELVNIKRTLDKKTMELSEAIATKDKFFSIIAHDLKSPLASILSLSRLLMMEYDSLKPQEAREIFKSFNLALNNIFNLLENLLLWSRSQRGYIQYNPEQHLLNDVITNSLSLLKSVSATKNITIKTILNASSPFSFDDNMMLTVLRNLINNAIKFTYPDGTIIIETSAGDSFVEIAVADNGIGMNEKTLNNLFKLDVSQQSKGTAGEQGTGLGLILCKEFIEKHNGTLTVESEQGKGTTFRIRLPK